MNGKSLHDLIAEKAEAAARQQEATAIAPGDHPNPLARSMGAGTAPRVCATPQCGALTEGALLEERIPTPFIDARDAVFAYFSRYCEKCIRRIKAEEYAVEQEKRHKLAAAARLKWWNLVWGGSESQYHDTTLDKLPDVVAAEKALRWTPEHPKGLLLIGDTGSGKTRTAYLLMKRILLETGIKPLIKKCAKLRHELARVSKSDDESARIRFVKELIEAPILFLDDLGQAAASDSFGEALFDIIEERTNQKRPIIATSQIGGSEYVEKFNDERQGLALSRRLAESCYKVTFTRPTKSLPKMEELPLELP